MISVQLTPYQLGEVLAMPFPVPKITNENEAFWTGGREGCLMISSCDDCGYLTHPSTPRCPSCFSEHVEPRAVSGRGTIYSFTINRQQWSPDLEVPYVIAIVALEEQSSLRLLTNIVGSPVQDVAIGTPVQVEFVERGAAFPPVFKIVVA
jgi:uncharacterized protein